MNCDAFGAKGVTEGVAAPEPVTGSRDAPHERAAVGLSRRESPDVRPYAPFNGLPLLAKPGLAVAAVP